MPEYSAFPETDLNAAVYSRASLKFEFVENIACSAREAVDAADQITGDIGWVAKGEGADVVN